MNTLIVKHSAHDTDAVSDANIENWYEGLGPDVNVVLAATEAQFNRLRLAHARKEIEIEYIDFQGDRVDIYESGKPHYWPEGMFGKTLELVGAILSESTRISRDKREDKNQA